MNKQNYIATLFISLSVCGMMLSMIHYHSDGLLCVHHAEEQHITQNELLCPVAGIKAIETGHTNAGHNGLLTYQETIAEVQELLFVSDFPSPDLGRAPPYMI